MLNKVLDVIFWPLIICGMVALPIIFIDSIIGTNLDWSTLTDTVPNQFCETHHNGFIGQKFNTYSNFIYLLIGTIILHYGKQDLKEPKTENFLVRFPLFSILMGVSMIYVFFGSTLYHATLSSLSRDIDRSGVLSCFILPLMYFSFRLFGLRHKTKGVLFMLRSYRAVILLFILLNIVLYILKPPFLPIIFALIAITVFLILLTWIKFELKFSQKYMLMSSVLLLTGFAVWLTDLSKSFCFDSSYFQLHGLWHILTGLSFSAIYMYFRSEEKIN